MTEAELDTQLKAATNQFSVWWENKFPDESAPKKLYYRIKYLQGYLKAVKLFRDESFVQHQVDLIRKQYGKGTRYNPF